MIKHPGSDSNSFLKSESLARAKSCKLPHPVRREGISAKHGREFARPLPGDKGGKSPHEGRGCPPKPKPVTKVTGTPSPVATSSPSIGGGYQYGCTIELHPNREIRIGKIAQKVRKRSGADTPADKECERYFEACHQLELIEKWAKEGGYWDRDRKGRFYFRQYTSSQREADRKVALDIIKLFQETRFSQEEETAVLLTSPKFAPPLPPPLPPEQLDVFKFASGQHPLPEPESAPRGLVLNLTTRKLKKPAGFSWLDTVNKARRFGTLQRRAILRSGAVMSRLYPEKNQTWEVTLTLPGSTMQAKKCLASHTSWLMNRLLQVVRDFKKKHKIDISNFYVWEWQKRGALHLHMALGCEDALITEECARAIKTKWFNLLVELGELTDVDMFAKSSTFTWKNQPSAWQSHCMPIEKNLAAYFAKYASKDKDSGMPKNGSPVLFYPTTWWGRSRDLAQAVRENTIKICLNYLTEEVADEKVNMLHSIINNYEALKQYAYDYEVNIDAGNARKMCVAFGVTRVIYFSDERFAEVTAEVETLALTLKEEASLLGAEWSGQLPSRLASIVRDGVFA